MEDSKIRFHCPIDGLALSAVGMALRCPTGHSFDLAKEGYCNLLLVQQKASLNPGDNKDMVEARRRFLANGYFEPIADKLAEYAKGIATEIKNPRILDAGCGEGYYLGRLQRAVPGANLAGIDISKWAVKAAAKSHGEIAWAVASNKQPPFAKHSLDMILCLFGFPSWESFRSRLVSGGALLLVDPAPEHLWELREQVYDTVKVNDLSGIDGAIAAGFAVEEETAVTFDITLEPNAAIMDLLAMTPHGYRITPEARDRLAGLESLSTKVSVVFRLLRTAKG